MCSTAKVYLEAPTFLPQLPSNLSNSGIPMIVCGLQALVQVPQHALHRRIYCRPQKVPQVKRPIMPNTGPRFVPKVSTNTITPTRFTQSSVRVSPYTEDGNAYDATRWFIHFSIHALQFLIILHGGSLPFGGDKNLKIIALSFISTGLDRCACKEPLAPSTWTKCSSRHLPRLSTMWKVKQDPFFADSRGLHHLYSAAHHWGSGFHPSGGRGVFKVYIHHLAKLWSLILLQRKGSYHTKIQLSAKQSFQFSFNIEVSFLGSPSSNWDLCWSSLGHPQWQKAGSCHSLFFHWAKPKPFVCSSLSLENLYHPCIWYHLHLFHRW